MQTNIALRIETRQPTMGALARHPHRLGDMSHGLALFPGPVQRSDVGHEQ